jgi:hypothetical protein
METLPIEYKKYGYAFKEVERHGDAAIYSQSNEDRNEPIAFIVFIVQKQEASNIYGRDYPAKETTPGNSLWGQYAYTCHSLERAHIRMNEFIARSNNKQLRTESVSIENEDPFGGLNF